MTMMSTVWNCNQSFFFPSLVSAVFLNTKQAKNFLKDIRKLLTQFNMRKCLDMRNCVDYLYCCGWVYDKDDVIRSLS